MSEYTPDTETVREQYTREQPPHIGTVGEVDEAMEAGARAVLREAWPILSAPLWEMHKPTRVGSRMRCFECATTHYPCPTMIMIYETDKELGL